MTTRSAPSAEPDHETGGARWWVGLIAVLGAGQLANGIWMLLDPGHWYTELPAGVPDFGPLNIHFVRDIGCAFVTTGTALLVAWRVAAWRTPLVAMAALFSAAHALLHVHDSLRGVVDSDHWWLDLPGVYLPAVLLILATRYFYQNRTS